MVLPERGNVQDSCFQLDEASRKMLRILTEAFLVYHQRIISMKQQRPIPYIQAIQKKARLCSKRLCKASICFFYRNQR